MTVDAAGASDSTRSGRFGGLLLLAAAVVLLLAGVVWFDKARLAHMTAASELAAAEAALAEVQGRERLVQQNRILLEAVNSLQQRAQVSGIMPRFWGARQINLRQQNLTRDQGNELLLTTARSAGQLLKPEEFEVSVTQPDEGLFDMPSGARPIMLTLSGTVHFRISEKPL